MRSKIQSLHGTRGRTMLLGLALLLMSLIPVSRGDNAFKFSRCEREALRAYEEALKLCQLAENPNPRLRCYEAARQVYISTVEACQNTPTAR